MRRKKNLIGRRFIGVLYVTYLMIAYALDDLYIRQNFDITSHGSFLYFENFFHDLKIASNENRFVNTIIPICEESNKNTFIETNTRNLPHQTITPIQRRTAQKLCFTIEEHGFSSKSMLYNCHMFYNCRQWRTLLFKRSVFTIAINKLSVIKT